jgi:hypothetical protein
MTATTATEIFYIVPGNDIIRTWYLEEPDPVTFAAVPVTSGTVSAFVAAVTSIPDDTTTAADPALVATTGHVGVPNPVPDVEYPEGTWGIRVDGAAITSALLDSLAPNSADPPKKFYLVVDRPGDVRRSQHLVYRRGLAVTTG